MGFIEVNHIHFHYDAEEGMEPVTVLEAVCPIVRLVYGRLNIFDTSGSRELTMTDTLSLGFSTTLFTSICDGVWIAIS